MMKHAGISIHLLGMVLLLNATQCVGWTWFYSKRFAETELKVFEQKKTLSFVQTDTPKFSQLILSWNSFRPHGYYSFWVQARVNSQWQEPHHMLDWGTDDKGPVQRSYYRFHPHGTSWHHVRLEIPKSKLGDAFRIKVVAHEGAKLKELKGLAVSISDMTKFNGEEAHSFHHYKSVKISDVPHQSQMVVNHSQFERICSPTSMSMLVGYIRQERIDPAYFADNVYDQGLDSYGSWPFNTSYAFELCHGKVNFWVARLSSFADLYHQLARGIPVPVSVRGELEGSVKPYNNGHLLLVIGWDARHKKVICHDPAFGSDDKTEVKYDLDSFLKAWERSQRLAYIADPISQAT